MQTKVTKLNRSSYNSCYKQILISRQICIICNSTKLCQMVDSSSC